MVKATAEASFWFPSKCAREASWGLVDAGHFSAAHVLDLIAAHRWAFAHNDSNGRF